MIPNTIGKYDDLLPYLEELGFVKYVDTNHIIKYKYDTEKIVIKLNYDLLSYGYADELYISTVYNRINKTYLNDHKGIFGYLNVIDYLNIEFKEYFRKKKIEKLLNDTK
jgi:hypothetical protein